MPGTVVFYISGHGFGHASREVEIIHALHARRPDAALVLRTSAAPDLLARTLRVPYTLRPGPCDSGIVQRSSVEHDDEATIRATIAFYEAWETRVADELAALADLDVRLIVADIPPLACEVAARRGVPAVAIGNFTWDWIYEDMPALTTAAPWLLPRLRSAYRQATHALELPFSGGFEVFPSCERLPLVARRPTHGGDETRARFGIPRDRPAVLLSFGGYGLPALALDRVDCLDDWTVVTTDRVTPPASAPAQSVIRLDEAQLAGAVRYEDLVAAVDVVLTKPGYGIVSECIAGDTALVYTSRGRFREYPVLVEAMPRYLRTCFLPQDDLFAGRWRNALERVSRAVSPPERPSLEGAARAATILAGFVASTSG